MLPGILAVLKRDYRTPYTESLLRTPKNLQFTSDLGQPPPRLAVLNRDSSRVITSEHKGEPPKVTLTYPGCVSAAVSRCQSF